MEPLLRTRRRFPFCPRTLRLGRAALFGLLVACVVACSGPSSGSTKSTTKGAAARPVELAKPTLEQVLEGGVGNVRVGAKIPYSEAEHPLFGVRVETTDPRLSRLEVWTDARGTVELIGAVFHDAAATEGRTAVAAAGLVAGENVGKLPGRYRPQRGRSQEHRHYNTLIDIHTSGRTGVWLGYEGRNQTSIYAVYRGRGADSARQTIAATTAQEARDLENPQHFRYHLRRWQELWADVGPRWTKTAELADGLPRAEARLELLVELHAVYGPLRAMNDPVNLRDPRNTFDGLVAQLLTDARVAAEKGSAVQRWQWAQVTENRGVLDDPVQVAAFITRRGELEQPVGLVAQRKFMASLRLGPRDGQAGARARGELETMAIERGRANKHPVLVKIEEAEREQWSPDESEFERLLADAQKFVALKDLRARLDWLDKEHNKVQRQGLSDKTRLGAHAAFADHVRSDVQRELDRFVAEGRLGVAIWFGLEAHRAGVGFLHGDKNLAQSAADTGMRRHAAELILALEPIVVGVEGQDGALRSRLEEPPYLMRPIHTMLGIFPAGPEDAALAAETLKLPFQPVTMRDTEGTLSLVEATGGGLPGVAFRSFDWLDGMFRASAELRAESIRISEWRERNDAERSALGSETAELERQKAALDRTAAELKARFEGRQATDHERRTVLQPAVAEENRYNNQVRIVSERQSKHSSEVTAFNQAVNAFNIRLNLERTARYRTERDRLDAALSSFLDQRLAVYREQLESKGLSEQAVNQEITAVSWLFGRGTTPARLVGAPRARKLIESRRLVYLEREIWRMDSSLNMVRAIVDAWNATALVEPNMDARVERIRPQIEKYVRGYDIKRIQSIVNSLPQPERARLHEIIDSVKL